MTTCWLCGRAVPVNAESFRENTTMPVICERAGCAPEHDLAFERLRQGGDHGPDPEERRQILNRFIRRGLDSMDDAGVEVEDSATCQYCGVAIDDVLSGTFHMVTCEWAPDGAGGDIWTKGITSIQRQNPELATDGGVR